MENFTKYIINKNNLLHNINQIKNIIGDDVLFCAVVKCDAYGLGIENIVPIINNEVDCYAVANCLEGVRLRKFTNRPIIILGQIECENIITAIEHKLSISVSNMNDVNNLIRVDSYKNINIHIKLNTGMNRYGVSSEDEFCKMIKVIKQQPNIHIEGIYTHFANNKKNDKNNEKQYKKYEKIIKTFQNDDIVYHCCSSLSSITKGQKCHDMVRVGFGLYSKFCDNIDFKDVVLIRSKITHIQHVIKGDCVGYSDSFIADKKIKIGVVPIGYGDGLNRRLSNRGYLIVNGMKAKIVGYVCMDCVLIDISNIKGVKLYDVVTILGTDNDLSLTLFDYAYLLDTSPYEVLTSFDKSRMQLIVV